jgi:cysteine desulfurase
MMKRIYLDNAATTPVDSRVLDAIMPYLDDKFGNPSSIHGYGRDVKVMLEEAREAVAAFIGAEPSEINFTSGGTEANNFAIKGIAFANLGRKNHIISSSIEHSAIIDTLEYLKTRFGFNITYLSVNKYGEINLEELEDSISNETCLICIMHSNNELGIINNIGTISKIANEKGIYLHTDSVQSIGKTAFRVKDIDCTTATFSGHKIYGPKGIGGLYIKKGTVIDKFIHGGKQERDKRGGTENIPAIAGIKKAFEILKKEMISDINHYSGLKSLFFEYLGNNLLEKIIINTRADSCLSNILNISFKKDKIKIEPDAIIIRLDMKGIAVSSGSACTSGAIQPSHVLKAVGYDDEMAKSSLRISFGRFNKIEDIEYFVKCLKELIE